MRHRSRIGSFADVAIFDSTIGWSPTKGCDDLSG